MLVNLLLSDVFWYRYVFLRGDGVQLLKLPNSILLHLSQVNENYLQSSSARATYGRPDITMYILDPAQGKGKHALVANGEQWDDPSKKFEPTHCRLLLLSLLLRHQKSQVWPFSFCVYEGDTTNFVAAWDAYLKDPESAANTLLTYVDPNIQNPEAKAKELLGLVRKVHTYTMVKVRNSVHHTHVLPFIKTLLLCMSHSDWWVYLPKEAVSEAEDISDDDEESDSGDDAEPAWQSVYGPVPDERIQDRPQEVPNLIAVCAAWYS